MAAPTGPMSPLAQDFHSLNANPLFNVGMGLLSSRYDPRINPFGAAMSGLGQSQAAADAQRKREQEMQEQQYLEKLRGAVGGFISDSSAVGHPGMQDGPGADFTPLQQQMAQAYGAAAQYGNPMQALSGYTDFLDDAGAGGLGGSDLPADIIKWEYYNKLSPDDQKRFLEMKRGQQIETIAGEIYRMFGGLDKSDRLSSLDEEAGAATRLSGAEALGTKYATRYDSLASSAGERRENYAQAQAMLEKVKENDLPTGLYTGLVYKVIPTPDQERLDALSEFVARARLKASGEIRPTDADVQGMKRALFGSSRTEEFTRDSLERLIREIEAQEHEFSWLQNMYKQPNRGQPAGQLSTPGTQPRPPGLMENPNPLGGMTDDQLDSINDMPLDELLKITDGY